MCTQNVNQFTQCGHKVVNGDKDRCENFLSEPKVRCQKIRLLKPINGLSPNCGGAPSHEPTITWIDVESIPSWSRENPTVTDGVSNLKLRVELLRKGSQKAVGGMKRFMKSVRSNRSSDGGASQLEVVSSEIESPSGGENFAFYPAVSEPLAESKTANTLIRANHLPRVIENSSARTLANLNTMTSTNTYLIRPSPPGLDVETATVNTTWPIVVSEAAGDWLQRLEEFARADERLARARDGRGYISFNLI